MIENLEQFKAILTRFTGAVEDGDGAALASRFTEDGIYEDGFYGEFVGPDAIRLMLDEHFWRHAYGFKWQMIDPVYLDRYGYAKYRFHYRSKLPGAEDKPVVFEGMSQFVFVGSHISSYREVFNTGIALCQLGFSSGRIHRHLEKKVTQVLSAK